MTEPAGDNWQNRLDESVMSAVHALWQRWDWLDATVAVAARWTPIAMLLVIALAAAGFGMPAHSAGPLAHYGLFALHSHRGQRTTALLGAVSAVVAAVAARLINEPVSRFFARPRPFEAESFPALVWHEPGNGFPSNHATGALALAVGMGFVPGYRVILYVLAALLCVSRIYGGLHYITDVIAGALHGTLVALVVRWLVFHYV